MFFSGVVDSQGEGDVSGQAPGPVERDQQRGLDRLHQVRQLDSDLVVKH